MRERTRGRHDGLGSCRRWERACVEPGSLSYETALVTKASVPLRDPASLENCGIVPLAGRTHTNRAIAPASARCAVSQISQTPRSSQIRVLRPRFSVNDSICPTAKPHGDRATLQAAWTLSRSLISRAATLLYAWTGRRRHLKRARMPFGGQARQRRVLFRRANAELRELLLRGSRHSSLAPRSPDLPR
jgi:hypothetical protein